MKHLHLIGLRRSIQAGCAALALFFASVSSARQLPFVPGNAFEILNTAGQDSAAPPQPGQPAVPDAKPKVTTPEQLKKQEHQRVLGVIPNFNTADVQDAARLTPKQKFRLAFRSAIDPATIGIAAAVAGFGQWNNSFEDYGQGAEGYFKRFGASYADTFDGTMIGNAILPSLLHQDPRYFRKGSGSFSSRLWYSITTTVRCKNDDGKWVPNYSNVMGNLASGGISNLYYPESDRELRSPSNAPSS